MFKIMKKVSKTAVEPSTITLTDLQAQKLFTSYQQRQALEKSEQELLELILDSKGVKKASDLKLNFDNKTLTFTEK